MRTCKHCSLPVPRSRDDEFCCRGCEAVWSILHEHGLERFYELGGGESRTVGSEPVPARHDWIDEAEQALTYPAASTGDARTRLELDIQGIHCAACVWVLQELWRRMDGALDIRINPALGSASLLYDRNKLDIAAWIANVESIGYRVGPRSERRPVRNDGLLIRLGICAALAMNAMMFSLSGYFGLEADGGMLRELFRYLSLAIATAAVLVGGPVFFRGAFAGLRRRVLHLDLPISLGIALAWSASVAEFFIHDSAGYFDTVTLFVALMLAGRVVQERAVQRNRQWLLENDGAEHFRARRIDPDDASRVTQVPILDIRSGDTLLLAAGDLVPVRAQLVDDASSFSLDWIRGESEPERFERDSEIPAGAFLSERRPVRARAMATSEESGLLDLLRTPNDDDVEIGERTSGWFRIERFYVIFVLLAASLAGLLWAWIDPSRILPVVTAVLVVTCPCALGLATPLAFDLALARLRHAGIFVRTRSLLTKATKIRRVFFDKTGTLTWGRLTAHADRFGSRQERDLAFSLAFSSNHPRSSAIQDLLRRDANYIDDLSILELPGSGIEARSGDGVARLGSPAFAAASHAHEIASQATVLGIDGRARLVFSFEEEDRPGMADELTTLRERGLDLWLLSGDQEERVRRAAARLGFPEDRALAAMTPEDKARIVRTLDDHDSLMLGDGLNDGPAMEVAFCAGTPAVDRPVLPSRCDFYYCGLGSGAVLETLSVATRFRRVVRSNLALAFLYNSVVLTLSIAGLMSPLLCAVVMPISSILLVSHVIWRLRRRTARTSHAIREGTAHTLLQGA